VVLAGCVCVRERNKERESVCVGERESGTCERNREESVMLKESAAHKTSYQHHYLARSWCVAVCCSVLLQCVAVCCSVLAIDQSQCCESGCEMMRSYRHLRDHVIISFVSSLGLMIRSDHDSWSYHHLRDDHEAPSCAPHDTATHCNTLQHTATHCNTLQHMRSA